MGAVFETIGPVAAVVAIGYLLAARRELHLPTLSDIAILVTSPALMFSVLSGTELEADRWGVLAGGTLFIAAGAAALAVGYLRTGERRWDVLGFSSAEIGVNFTAMAVMSGSIVEPILHARGCHGIPMPAMLGWG